MVIRVYVSTTSGNMEIKKRQEYIRQVLETRKIQYEQVDIAAPDADDDKQFMRDNGQPEEGQSSVLPPQVFNETVYCGNYLGFQEAVEIETLQEFLKLGPGKALMPSPESNNGHMSEPVMEQEGITCA